MKTKQMMACSETIRKRLKCDLSEWKPIPFWSWNGDLREDRLKKQIEAG